MYAPRFVITNALVRSLGSIEAAKDTIEHTELSPETDKQFSSDALIQTIYCGTHIEGNSLTQNQTRQILEGATPLAQNRDVQEVINYRRAINIVEELASQKEAYLVDSLRDIQGAITYNIASPDRVGFFRQTQIVIREEGTGNVIFTPPQAFQIPTLLEEFFTWLNSFDARDLHPVIRAAIVHYILSAIYPFVEGNGHTTRAFVDLVLFSEGYEMKRYYSLEEQFESDLDMYYEAFFLVDSQNPDIASRDLTPWIEYFAATVASRVSLIKDRVRSLSVTTRTKVNVGEQVALSARQMKLIDFLSENGRAQMRDLKQVLPMVSDDTILRDLTSLTKKGIIEKEGTTKASSYILKS